MKTAKEILEETLTRYGLKVWEAHTDKMNKMIAIEAMERHAEQFKISSSPVLADSFPADIQILKEELKAAERENKHLLEQLRFAEREIDDLRETHEP